jgi:hypothetical protein
VSLSRHEAEGSRFTSAQWDGGNLLPQLPVVATVRRGILLIVAAFLLFSMGGAIVAAPVTVPALVWAMRTSGSSVYRGLGAAVLALTIGEAAWALTYVTAGEAQPTIWLVPLAAAGAVLVTAPRWSTST